MAKTVQATANPSVLLWARESAGFSVEEAAHKVPVAPEKLAACEHGDGFLTFHQLEELANAYKRPLALFYLPEPPSEALRIHDFRLDANVSQKPLSPALKIEVRRAHQRRDEALELSRELSQTIHSFTPTASAQEDTEIVAARINQLLHLDTAKRSLWRNASTAYATRKAAVETLGVLVFEASRIPVSEMRGLSLTFDQLPVAVINGADSHNGRSFSLLHELTHLLLRQGGVCDLVFSESRSADARTEAFCNAVAAAALMPASEILAILPEQRTRAWTMDELAELAKPFRVSREAMLRRLVTLGRATRGHYFAMRSKFIEEYQQYRQDQKSDGDGGPSPAVMAVRNLGKPFVELVFGAYAEDRIGLATVSDYLGVKLKHLPRIRDLMQKREVAV